jgi:hypothetical protein
MVGVELDRVGFAAPVGIDQVGADEIARLHGLAVQHRERRVTQRSADRPPQIDHLDPALQELVRLIRQMFAHAVRAGQFRLVDMDTRGGLPRTGAAHIGSTLDALADGMVKDNDAVGLQRRPEEGFGGGVIDAAHFLVVVEIPHDGRVTDQGKTLAVKRKAVRNQPRIEDRYLMRFGQRGGSWLAGRRIEGVGSGFSGGGRKIIELSGDER